jgi:hypothetical protein
VNKQIAALVVATVILTAVTVADAQQQAKVPKIGLLSLRGSGYESFRRELGKLAILRVRTSVSSFDPLIISSTGSPPWLMSWSVSKSTYSSRARRLMP